MRPPWSHTYQVVEEREDGEKQVDKPVNASNQLQHRRKLNPVTPLLPLIIKYERIDMRRLLESY